MNTLSILVNRLSKHHHLRPEIVFLSVLFLGMPQSVFGAVFISEIAWMGTETSANDEWIELKNDSSEQVDITGWTLVASDGSPSVTLSGLISSNGYFLLERTDDVSVPGISADQIFSGALSNTGEDLILKDVGGNVIDRVNMSDGWQGGDNTTKETLQKVGTSWTTAPATPKAENKQGSSPTLNTEVESGGTSYTSGTALSTESKTVKRDIALYAGEDKIVLVGQQVQFVAEMTKDKKYVIDGVTFHWNFGDGTVGTGKKTPHMYLFPGTYVVVLNATYEGVTYTARTITYVSAAQISVVDSGVGYVTVENTSSQEANLAGWTIEHADGTYYIPEDTIVLPESTLTIRHPFNTSNIRLVQSGSERIEVEAEVKHVNEYEDVVLELAEKLSVIESGLASLSPRAIQSQTRLYAVEEQIYVPEEQMDLIVEDSEEEEQVSHNNEEESVILYDESEKESSHWLSKIGGFIKSLFIRN